MNGKHQVISIYISRAKSGGGVGGLPEQPGREPVVEREHALVPDDAHEDGGRGGLLRPGRHFHHLHAVLDQVQRLHEARRRHSEDGIEVDKACRMQLNSDWIG